MSQLTLNFNEDKNFEEIDFLISDSNFHAAELINSWRNWHLNSAYIYGPKLCGKTLLAYVFKNKTDAFIIDDTSNELPKGFNSFIIENIENFNSKQQTELFHIFNQVNENNYSLLITSSTSPKNLNFNLADLKSRLCSITSAKISEPDDSLLTMLIFKKFTDLQLRVKPEVIEYIVKHIERSFDSAISFVDLINKHALSEHKNISIPFVKKLLENQ